MNKLLAEKYMDLKFNDTMIDMILDILSDDENNYKVLEALARDHAQGGIGLTKTMMYKTIKIKPNPRNRYSKTEKEIFITRRSADLIIATLLGASLIQYEIIWKDWYYSLTPRGIQVCVALKKHDLI